MNASKWSLQPERFNESEREYIRYELNAAYWFSVSRCKAGELTSDVYFQRGMMFATYAARIGASLDYRWLSHKVHEIAQEWCDTGKTAANMIATIQRYS